MNDYAVEKVTSFVSDDFVAWNKGDEFRKYSPLTGETVCTVSSAAGHELDAAVETAKRGQSDWGRASAVKRGELVRRMAQIMERDRDMLVDVTWRETGKSKKDANGELQGAIEQAYFMAGEGRRMFGKTTTSAMPERTSLIVRNPVGVAGLITPANTPFPNVAWKLFPALVCGNSVILKPSEDAPLIARAYGLIAREAGIPAGVVNILHGSGAGVGAALVEHQDVDLISFTGSTSVGRQIGQTAGRRLAKVFLELGGKNPLVVCDDADLENAVKWAVLSSFSNAGQRCASSSRLIVFDNIYEEFRDRLVEATSRLKVGAGDDDDLGPVLNERQLQSMLAAVQRSVDEGARILTGGGRMTENGYGAGYFMTPTILENVDPDGAMSNEELFGPITCLYRVSDLEEATELSNRTAYGLTACIHTASVHRAMKYTTSVGAGVANVNAGTYGSEPHMPFGGVKQSGNGLREPGSEALDVYSELKNINVNYLPNQL